MPAVQGLLGDANVSMTLDRYGHLFSNDIAAVAQALDTPGREAGKRGSGEATYCGMTAVSGRVRYSINTGKYPSSWSFSVPSVRFELTLDGF